MFRKFPSPSPGPMWEALPEPTSSDDEFDTEVARDPPQSAPPAFASSSADAVVNDSSHSQMKRKESTESLFISKKRARFGQAARSDQDDVMDLEVDEHAKNMGISAPVSKIMGGLGGRQHVSPTTVYRRQSLGNSSTNAKPHLPRNKSAMEPPAFLPQGLSESAVTQSNRPVTRDPPSKLNGLSFDTYKRAERKTVLASNSGHSAAPASTVHNPVDKGKTSLKQRQVLSAPQTTRHPSTTKTKEVIEISEDDESPPAPIYKSKSKLMKPSSIEKPAAPEQDRQRSRTTRKSIASGSASSSVTKKFLPKAPIEVIEILDSDEEQLSPTAQPQQRKSVGTPSGSRLSELVQECATGSNTRRGQHRHMSSSGGDSAVGNDRDIDRMNVDEVRNLQPASVVPAVAASDRDNFPDNPFNNPSSPRALLQEVRVADDVGNKATRGLIPLPSSSSSSIGLSPKDSYTSPAPTTLQASLTRSSCSQPSSSTSPISVRKPTTAGTSTSSYSNRLGFSSVTVPSSLQVPPPAGKHSVQFARKLSNSVPQQMSDEDEDYDEDYSEPSEREATAQIKANKGKEKEIHQSSSSSSGTESINMRGLRDALVIESDKADKQQLVSPTLPKQVQGQTLAEAIISAGQLNRMKKKMRRQEGNTKDVPIDLTSDIEGGDGVMVDEKSLKAAIGSARLLVNLMPSLKEKGGASSGVITGGAKVTDAVASPSREKKLSLSPSRTRAPKVEPPKSPSSYPLSRLSPKRNAKAHDLLSQRPSLPPAEMQLKSESPFGKTSGATGVTAQPQTERSAFGFKSGITMVGPPERISLPKRPSVATIERTLADDDDSSSILRQTPPTGTIGLSGEAGGSSGDVPMIDVPSRKTTSPMLGNVLAISPPAAMTSSSIPLPLSPSQPVLVNSSAPVLAEPHKRLTPPKMSPLIITETSFVTRTVPGDRNTGTLSQQTPFTGPVSHSSSRAGRDDASMTFMSNRKSYSPKLANVQPTLTEARNESSAAVTSTPSRPTIITHSLGGEGDNIASTNVVATKALLPKLPEPLIIFKSDEVSSPPQPGSTNDSIAKDITAMEGNLQSKIPLSMQPPASSLSTIAHTSTTYTAVQDRSLDTLGLPSDDSHDDDEKECRALLQSPFDDIDLVPNHEVRPSLQDNIVVRRKAHINVDMPVASSSTLSATTEVLNGQINVSPPIPGVPARRSSRRSSRSSASERLDNAFDDDFGPFDSVPATRTPTPEDQEPSTSLSPPGSPKTYGGFPALTWKNFRKDINNFIPKTYYAKDLPHALQDHINSMSEYTQMMNGMRDLFKATILENTVEDEPDAPPIEIWNNVDEQSTPPWEFYYTNHMWLGEGVPSPDIKNLVSCTCKGACNPKSKSCACLKRQQEATGDPLLEFAYDKNGRLKIPGYPIFECNDLCGCSDECRNRVVQHGRKVSVNIGKTEKKGWGVFAGPKKIPGGTYIGIYSGELLTDAVAQERGIKYNKFGRTYLFDIDFHHLKDRKDWENYFTVDAYHAGNFTRFLNHSCDPNCRLYACYVNEGDIQKPLLAIFTRRDIDPYQEICFNYQGYYPDNDDSDDSDDNDDNDDRNRDSDYKKDSIYVPCRCGAKNCTGTMFK